MKLATVALTLLVMAGVTNGQEEAEKNPVVLMKTSMGDITLELFAKEAPKTVQNFLDLAQGRKEFKDTDGKMVTRPFFDGLVFHRIIDNFMLQGGCPLGSGSGGPGYSFEDEINADALGLEKLRVMNEQGAVHQWLRRDINNVARKLHGELGIKSQEEFNKRRGEVETRLKGMSVKKAYEYLGYRYDSSRNSHKPLKGVLAMANSGPNTNGSQFFINLIDTPWLTGKHTVFGKVIKGMDIAEKMAKVEVGPGSKPKEEVKIISIRRVED
jgi:cyclophilin family peptidyl-prolyl cis-trans isomerase